MVPTRRQILATIVFSVSGIAGCLSFGSPELVIENNLDQSVTIDTDITRMSDKRIVVQAERSIESNKTTEFSNPFDQPGQYRIQITTHETNSGGEKSIQTDDAESVEIRATIGSDGVTFTKPNQ